MNDMDPSPSTAQHSSAHVLNSLSAGLKESGLGIFSLYYLSKEENPSAIADEVWTASLRWANHPSDEFAHSAYGQSTENAALAFENLLNKAGWLTKYPVPPGLCPCTPEEQPWRENTAES